MTICVIHIGDRGKINISNKSFFVLIVLIFGDYYIETKKCSLRSLCHISLAVILEIISILTMYSLDSMPALNMNAWSKACSYQ